MTAPAGPKPSPPGASPVPGQLGALPGGLLGRPAPGNQLRETTQRSAPLELGDHVEQVAEAVDAEQQAVVDLGEGDREPLAPACRAGEQEVATADGREQARYAMARGFGRRAACALVGSPRSGLEYEAKKPARERPLRERLRRLARQHPRYGYRQAWAMLRREASGSTSSASSGCGAPNGSGCRAGGRGARSSGPCRCRATTGRRTWSRRATSSTTGAPTVRCCAA
jgi:hypothetical protein